MVKPERADTALSAPQRAMNKLGLTRDIDLALHLPLRYEDETSLQRLADAREGEVVQLDATVAECRIEQRSRRQLVARVTTDDGQALVLRFLNFYPSQQKQLAVSKRVRVRGELRGGLLGREMVHPAIKPADAALGHRGVELHHLAVARIGQALQRGFVFVAQRQVQRQVDVACQPELVHRALGG
jgi:ATP-dependent DNA helicase RecG